MTLDPDDEGTRALSSALHAPSRVEAEHTRPLATQPPKDPTNKNVKPSPLRGSERLHFKSAALRLAASQKTRSSRVNQLIRSLSNSTNSAIVPTQAGTLAFASAWVFGERQVDLAIGFEEHMHQMAGEVPEPELVS